MGIGANLEPTDAAALGHPNPAAAPRALLLGCEVGLDGCVRLLLLRGRVPRGHRESHGADPVLGSSGLRAGMLGQGKGALPLAAAAAREKQPLRGHERGEEER